MGEFPAKLPGARHRPCPAKTPGLNPPLAVSHGGFSKAKYMLTRVSWDLKLTMAISKIGI